MIDIYYGGQPIVLPDYIKKHIGDFHDPYGTRDPEIRKANKTMNFRLAYGDSMGISFGTQRDCAEAHACTVFEDKMLSNPLHHYHVHETIWVLPGGSKVYESKGLYVYDVDPWDYAERFD